MTDQGVIYYGTGDMYTQQAQISARSLKKHNDVSVTLFTDQSIDSAYIDNVVQISPGKYPFYDRIDYFRRTPYEKTIYIDTDTYIVGDITPIFEMLGRFDIAAAHNVDRDSAADHMSGETIDLAVPESFPEYQCGLIGYQNNEVVQHLFNDWQSRYKPYRDKDAIDQPHFREALYNNPVSIGTLPPEYNVLVNLGAILYNDAKLIHYAGSNKPFIGTEIPTKNMSEKIVCKLNGSNTRRRVVIVKPESGIKVLPTPKYSISHRIRLSIHKNGILDTLKRAIEELM